MLEALNRYAHGFVAVPVVVACRKGGMFEALRARGPMIAEALAKELGANEGHLRAALRLLQSLGWISVDGGALALAPEAENERDIPEDAVALLMLPLEGYLTGQGPQRMLAPWIERSARRWGARSPRTADLVDGVLAVRVLNAIERSGCLKDGSDRLLDRVAPGAREELGSLFGGLGWASREAGATGLTDFGRFILDRALIVGTLAAYRPMLSRMPELLFGDAHKVFDRDEAGQERHVDRTLNVASSGFQHDRYFADVDEMIVDTFDHAAIEEQPDYVADMGCGDGTFLKRVYETVVARTSRGRVLDTHPLTLIGIDFNDAALEATRLTLGSRPHVLLKGDIGDPAALLGALRDRGVDPDSVLHIRSFLDHDRPFVAGDRGRARRRARMGYRGVYVNDVGRSIPASEMMQALVEHLGRWAAVVNRHGLIVLEVHNLDPRIANAYFDSTESIHFDAYHAFSMQYLVEAAEFLAAAGEAGLFPRSGSSRRYPKALPFARITLNWFERRPYAIRPADPADLPALVELERASTPAPLQSSEAELLARLEREPGGQLVLEKDGRIVAAAYSQRIEAVQPLESTRHADQATLRDENGSVVQLLGLVVHSGHQDLGLGDELLEFVLHRSELLPGVERVAGISRCKDWVRGGDVSFEDYVHARTASGEPQDTILRFHARHGARVRKVVSGYRPVDADNDGSGVLIEYDLADRRKGARAPVSGTATLGDGRVAGVVEASVREVLGPRRQEAFAASIPLMDMGLDSMDLTELKSLLSRRLGLDLDPTLFFRHRTAAAVADHLESRSARKDPGVEAPRPRPGGPVGARAPRPVPKARIRATRRVAEEDDRIAIVGMACRFASANSAEEYWTLLRDGAHAVRTAPPNRRGWARKPVTDADPSIASAVRYGGFLDDVAGFDAGFFGISPREARSMDPQQRMLLETTWHAFEDAGVDASSLAASATGVFVGICTHDYEVLQLLSGSPQAFDSHFTSGNLASVAAGRIAYCYGFHGPALSVDTACSSSLVALHLAVQSLRSEESDLALACGVNLMLAQEMSLVYARLRVLAPDGRCKTFDASADGYVRGEGCGVVVLKRLAEAQADGDRILAVVRGSAINQDGPSNGLTAPNGDAQEAVIRQALESAGVSPLEVSHIEAHGTGTVIGDPIEFQALARVFGPGRAADQPLVIASAKTTVGHIEPAAGMAGLIKVVLSLQNEQIPRHLHLSEPNPLIRLDEIPAVIPTEGRAWPRVANGAPRRAGVSSFGLSGTNAHVVVEEAPGDVAIEGRAGRGRPVQIFTLSARTPTALESLARAYEAFLRPRRDLRVADVCFTASVGRAHFEHRLGIVFERREDLLLELGRAAQAGTGAAPTGERTVRGTTAAQRPGIAFLFSGQGSQYPGMGGELFDSEPVFREALEDCDEVLREECGVPLLSILFPRGAAADLTDTSRLQPALFSVEYALSRLWRSWGIEPDAVIGHSLGEYVAACVAGVMSLEDALRLVAARGRLMGDLEVKGAMVAVATDAARVAAAIAGHEHELSIACLNGPSAVVLSGRPDAVSVAVRALEAEGVRTKALIVSNAFHSPLMDPILDAFEEEVAKIALRPPDRVLVSNLLGREVTGEVTTAGYWRRHLREPVRFAEGVEALFRAGCDTFVEIGPGTTLLGLGRLGADDPARTWVPSLRPGQPESTTLLSSLGALYVRGAPVDWAGFYRGADRRKVALPGYAFERKEYWFDDGEPAAAAHHAATAAVVSTERTVTDFYNAFSGVQAAPQLRYLTFAPFPDVVPGFSWVNAFAFPHENEGHFRLFAEAQREIRSTVFRHVDFARCARVVDFGCGYGSDLIDLARRHPHLRLTGFSLSDKQVAIAAARAREEGVSDRVQFFKKDSARDAFPPENDLVFGFEVAHHVRDKRALFANVATHLREGGHLLLADFVSTTSFSIDHADTSSFFVTTDEWVDLLSENGFLATECVDISREVSNSLHDPRFEENLARVLRESPEPTVEAAFRSFDQLGRLLAKRLARYVLMTSQRRPDLPTEELRKRNRETLEQPKPYSEISLAHGCYEVEWRRKDRSAPSRNGHGIRGQWLIFADDEGVAEGLGRNQETGDCIRVTPGEALERVSPGEWRVNADRAEDFRALLAEVSREAPLRGVVHLWSLRAAGGAEPTLTAIRDAQRLGVSSVLHLVQALAAANLGEKPRVWLVTEGAQPAGDRPGSMRVAQAPLCGLARSLAAELPELWGGMVDLAPDDPLPDRVAAIASELAGADGELHVAYRNKERLVARLVRRGAPKAVPAPVRGDATYLVAGGLGALGLRVAGWLVERGARHVVLAGRRRPDEPGQAAIRTMQGAGARVVTVEADISEPTDVARLLQTIASSLPPLRGIVNAAGVLDDGVLVQQTPDRFRKVMAPKVDGSWNLHAHTKDLPLDFFVFFSSSVSILSLAGRGNYGAANAFMDALAHHRQSLGLAALSVNWGAWGETGMTANLTTNQRRQLAEQGIGEIDPSEGLRLLGDLIGEGRAQVGVSPMNWAKYFRGVAREQVSAYFTGVLPPAAVAEDSGILASIQKAAASEVRDLLGRFLQERVARILGYGDAADVGRDAVLLELGFDSLMAVQLRNAIRQSLAVDVPIGKLFSSRSIDSLTQVVHERLPPTKLGSPLSRGPGERVEVI